MIDVQITNNFPDIKVSIAKFKKLIKAICNRFKLSNAIIDITIVDNAQIRRLNNQFLNRKSITDCLSFDLSDDLRNKSFELIINGELAVKEANLRGHSYEAELALYITHSLLHNLGFDDAVENQAKKNARYGR